MTWCIGAWTIPLLLLITVGYVASCEYPDLVWYIYDMSSTKRCWFCFTTSNSHLLSSSSLVIAIIIIIITVSLFAQLCLTQLYLRCGTWIIVWATCWNQLSWKQFFCSYMACMLWLASFWLRVLQYGLLLWNN